jgi:hypothetical protein
MTRVSLIATAAALVVATAHCGEYAHTNPMEPDAKVSITIIGPDGLNSRHELVVYAYTSDPVVPVGVSRWASDNPSALEFIGDMPNGSGMFRTIGHGSTVVRVSLGTHTQSKRVVVE